MHHRIPWSVRLVVLFLALCGCFVPPIDAADFLVLSPFDSGGGTLRQAILDANSDVAGGPHRILFNLPVPTSKTIILSTPLPSIVATVTIDGYSQPGAASNTLITGNDAQVLIEIDGSGLAGATPLLDLLGAGSTVRGLSLSPPPNAVAIDLRDHDMGIEGCWIGLRPDGSVRPMVHGIQGLVSSDGHRIGGPLPAQRNVIAGQTIRAIVLSGSGMTIQGNYIGTDPTGSVAAGPSANGFALFFGSSNNQVGGRLPGEGNLLAGLDGVAIEVQGGTETGQGNRIEGNLIGTDASGTRAIPNVGDGISVSDNVGAIIFGNTVANLQDGGITLGTPAIDVVLNSLDTIVQGNRIGLGLDDSPMPNQGVGIRIAASNGTLVGGFGPGHSNIIVGTYGSPGVGVAIYEVPGPRRGGLPALRNSILGNSIYGNVGLGVDLVVGPLDNALDGPTPNDPGDLDEGVNGLQNAPRLRSASPRGTDVHLAGDLISNANQSFEIQLYSSRACHPSGYGEGETLLGTVQVATDTTGFAAFEAIVPPPPSGDVGLSGLATDASGNTSEFGPCLDTTSVLAVPGLSWPGAVTLIAGLALAALGALRSS